MKIYINNLNIDVLSIIMNNIKEQTYIQIDSLDGNYQINTNTIKKLNCVDDDIKIYNNYYENFSLIVDPSYYTRENVNKIPPQHISTKTKRCFFKINKNSEIKLVVEGIVIEENTPTKNSSNNDYGINPNDIYFETTDNIDINNALIKKEIIVFLSLLN